VFPRERANTAEISVARVVTVRPERRREWYFQVRLFVPPELPEPDRIFDIGEKRAADTADSIGKHLAQTQLLVAGMWWLASDSAQNSFAINRGSRGRFNKPGS
jgi:hypothetical protein